MPERRKAGLLKITPLIGQKQLWPECAGIKRNDLQANGNEYLGANQPGRMPANLLDQKNYDERAFSSPPYTIVQTKVITSGS